LEVWDYIGGASFRGFVAEKREKQERSLFLFFEQGVEGTELEHGFVALIDLAMECFDCQNLVVCLDRQTPEMKHLVRDLGWVGLELLTLSNWASPATASTSRLAASRRRPSPADG